MNSIVWGKLDQHLRTYMEVVSGKQGEEALRAFLFYPEMRKGERVLVPRYRESQLEHKLREWNRSAVQMDRWRSDEAMAMQTGESL